MFFQACRGSKLDYGAEVDEVDAAVVEKPTVRTIPTAADFLLAYSVVPGQSFGLLHDTRSIFWHALLHVVPGQCFGFLYGTRSVFWHTLLYQVSLLAYRVVPGQFFVWHTLLVPSQSSYRWPVIHWVVTDLGLINSCITNCLRYYFTDILIHSSAQFASLFACSLIAGHYSWRNNVDGSWFIQALCDVLQLHGDSMELMQMMTLVNKVVAYDFAADTGSDFTQDAKQMPCMVSMLTKQVYFRPKY